jgi:hypothetical protein
MADSKGGARDCDDRPSRREEFSAKAAMEFDAPAETRHEHETGKTQFALRRAFGKRSSTEEMMPPDSEPTNADLLVRRAGSTVLAFACALIVHAIRPATAAPRQTTYEGCTARQLQTSEGARACIDEGAQEITIGRPTHHAVFCSSNGKMSCCECDFNDNIVGAGCVDLSSRRRPVHGVLAPTGGFSPSGIFYPPPHHRGLGAPRPPYGGVMNPGGGRHPARITGFRPPSGGKTMGGASGPPTIYRSAGHHFVGRR